MTETPAADIVERLRGYRPRDEWGDGVHHVICTEAATEIEALRAALAEADRKNDALNAEWNDAQRKLDEATDCLHDATCIIGHLVPMDAYALAGKKLVAKDVWQRAVRFLTSIRGEK